MIARLTACLALSVLLLGCNGEDPVPPPDKKDKDESSTTQLPAESPDSRFTHTITMETEYYTSGPQQGRPPDGNLPAGTKITLVESAGSYSLVEAADGTKAYVTTEALKPMTENVATSDNDISTVVSGNNLFACDLYAQLRAAEGNLFFSPTSISTALAMAYAGARGATETEMAQALHFQLAQDQLHPTFAAVNETLNPTGKPYDLAIANRLWGQKGYGFMPAFLETTRTHYGAQLAELDFVNAAAAARDEINTWVEDQTNDKIQDLIPAGALNAMTRLVLTNAIYFNGTWQHQFDKEVTHDAPFHVTAEQQVDVPMMHQQESLKYGELAGLQIVELPYKGDDLSMVIMLPKQIDGIGQLEAALTVDNMDKWTKGLGKQEVNLWLPKFKMTSEFELNQVLSSLGMPSAFSPGTADFSGMSSQQQLFISAVIHKAFVDVNEEGTEAAAATGIVMRVTSVPETPPPTFRADHPFLFVIRDTRTGSILFLGRVMEPVVSGQ